jgi:PAS domain S-box-containing protein
MFNFNCFIIGWSRKHMLIFSFFFLFILQPTFSSFSNMRFVNLYPESGLANGNIISLLQDHEGYMWIGTAEGLNKYNGLQFVAFKNQMGDSTSLSGNYINALLEDSHHNLWVGVDNGLCRYNRDLGNFERITFPDINNQPFSHTVNSLVEDNEKRLWVGTNGGVFLLDYANRQFIPYSDKLIGGRIITRIAHDSNEIIYFADVEKGLIKHNPETGAIEVYSTTHPVFKLKENEIYTLVFDNQNRLWIGYDSKGVSVIDEGAKTIAHFEHDPSDPNSLVNNHISSIVVDTDGSILIGTNGGGLSVLNPETRRFTNYTTSEDEGAIISNSIIKLYQAPDGLLWIGCWGSGISIFDERFYKFNYFKHNETNPYSLSGKSVTSFAEDKDGNIWISTDGGGIDCFDLSTMQFYNHKSENNKVLALTADNRGGLWSGMWNGGLNYFEIEGTRLKLKKSFKSFEQFSSGYSSVFKLYHDPLNRLWVGGFNSTVYLYNSPHNSFIPLGELIGVDNDTINNISVNDILFDSDNIMWVSTQDFGLLKVNLENHEYKIYYRDHTNPTGQPAKLICFTHEDSKNRFWVGTNVGLSLFDKNTETFRTYTVNDGLPDNNVVGLLEDDNGNFWISSNKGLSKVTLQFDGDAYPKLLVRNYGISDGLQGNLFNRWAYFKSSSGEMFFGGLNGFNVFHPDSLPDNNFIPPVHLTDFLLFNQKVVPGTEGSALKVHINHTDEIVLKHHQNYFTFKFVALNYIMSEKNEYAYMLEGLDKEWVYVQNRTEATYTQLLPGSYVFRVKASNNDGYWNENGTSVKITILPPWWQTWWFRSMVMLLILSLIIYLSAKTIAYFHHLANQTILNERNQLQTLIDNMPDQVFIKDNRSRFVVANTRTAKQLGFDDSKHLINKTDYDFYDKTQADAFFSEEKVIMETRELMINQESVRILDGNERFFSSTKCPIINSKGETIGLIGIVCDITNQKITELQIVKQSRELQKMNKTLLDTNQLLEDRQAMVEEQSEELLIQKNELLRTNEQLNQIVATKDKLFSIIAHDIKNPFNSILGFSELLLNNIEQWDDNKKMNAAKMIFNSSNELLSLLENLLQWAREQRGLVASNPTNIDIRAFIDSQLRFFKYFLEKKNINASTYIPDSIHTVFADQQLLDTILRNLIGNAIKFTPHGGKIEISVSSDGQMAVFNVKDYGVGISPERMEHLFSIDQKSITLGTNKEKGTGLGLILVKEFVEKQGGSVWLESILGEGSNFYFSVPLHKIHLEGEMK